MAKHQTFNHKLYDRVARAIHEAFCEDDGWCNYGQQPPEYMRDDINLPAEERQDRAGLRLDWMHHCQISVDAENIAARIQFGKGAKVRK